MVVTAQRRSENLQNVPVSVGVISGADQRTFTAGGDDTLLSLSGRVPSLYIESTTGRSISTSRRHGLQDMALHFAIPTDGGPMWTSE